MRLMLLVASFTLLYKPWRNRFTVRRRLHDAIILSERSQLREDLRAAYALDHELTPGTEQYKENRRLIWNINRQLAILTPSSEMESQAA